MKKLLSVLLSLLVITQFTLPAFAAAAPAAYGAAGEVAEAGEDPLPGPEDPEEPLAAQAVTSFWLDGEEPIFYVGRGGTVTLTGGYRTIGETTGEVGVAFYNPETAMAYTVPGLSLSGFAVGADEGGDTAVSVTLTVTAEAAADRYMIGLTLDGEMTGSGLKYLTVAPAAALGQPSIKLASNPTEGGLKYTITPGTNGEHAESYKIDVYKQEDNGQYTLVKTITGVDPVTGLAGGIPLDGQVKKAAWYKAVATAIGKDAWLDSPAGWSGEAYASAPPVSFRLNFTTPTATVNGVKVKQVGISYKNSAGEDVPVTPGKANNAIAGAEYTFTLTLEGRPTASRSHQFDLAAGSTIWANGVAELAKGIDQELFGSTIAITTVLNAPTGTMDLTIDQKAYASEMSTVLAALWDSHSTVDTPVLLPVGTDLSSLAATDAALAAQAQAALDSSSKFSGYKVTATGVQVQFQGGGIYTWTGAFTTQNKTNAFDKTTGPQLPLYLAYDPATMALASGAAALEALVAAGLWQGQENPFQLVHPAATGKGYGYILAPVAHEVTNADLAVQAVDDSTVAYYANREDMLAGTNAYTPAQIAAMPLTAKVTKLWVRITNPGGPSGQVTNDYRLYVVKKPAGPPTAIATDWPATMRAGTAYALEISLTGLAAIDMAPGGLGTIEAEPLFFDMSNGTPDFIYPENAPAGFEIDASDYDPVDNPKVVLRVARDAAPGSYAIRVGYSERLADGDTELYVDGYSSDLLEFELVNVSVTGLAFKKEAPVEGTGSDALLPLILDGGGAFAPVELGYAINPANPSDPRVTAKSLNERLVKVTVDTAAQTVTVSPAKAAANPTGETYIAITSADGSFTSVLRVMVAKPVATAAIKEKSLAAKAGSKATLTPQATGGAVKAYTLGFFADAACETPASGAQISGYETRADGKMEIETAAPGVNYVVLYACGYDGVTVASAPVKLTITTAPITTFKLTSTDDENTPLPASVFRQADGSGSFDPALNIFYAQARWQPDIGNAALGLEDSDKVEWTVSGPAEIVDLAGGRNSEAGIELKPGAPGTVKLTAKFKGKTATWTLKVQNPPVGYGITSGGSPVTAVTVESGKTVTLKAAAPADAAFPGATWQWMTRDASVATVNSAGKVTGVGPGVTDVFLAAGGREYAGVTVTVNHRLTGVSFLLKSLKIESAGTPGSPAAFNISTDEAFCLVGSYATPAETKYIEPDHGVTYASNQPKVVFDNDASPKTMTVLEGFTGTVKVTASYGGKSATLNVTICAPGSLGLIDTFEAKSPLQGTLVVGKSTTLKLKVAGVVSNTDSTRSTAISADAAWASSAPDVISVDKNGKITALKASAAPVEIYAFPAGAVTNALLDRQPATVTFTYHAAAPAQKLALYDLNGSTTKTVGKLAISNLQNEYLDDEDDLRLVITGAADTNKVVWASDCPDVVKVEGAQPGAGGNPANTATAKLVWLASSTKPNTPKGTVKITASYGGKTATVVVTSKEYAPLPQLDTNALELISGLDPALKSRDLNALVAQRAQNWSPLTAAATDHKITWKVTSQYPKNTVTLKNGFLTMKKEGYFEISGAVAGHPESPLTLYGWGSALTEECVGRGLALFGDGGNAAITLPADDAGYGEAAVYARYTGTAPQYSLDANLEITFARPDGAGDPGVTLYYIETLWSGQFSGLVKIHLQTNDGSPRAVTMTATDRVSGESAELTVQVVPAAPESYDVDYTASTRGDGNGPLTVSAGSPVQLGYTLKTGASEPAADQRMSWAIYQGETGVLPFPEGEEPVSITPSGVVSALRSCTEPFRVVGTPVAKNVGFDTDAAGGPVYKFTWVVDSVTLPVGTTDLRYNTENRFSPDGAISDDGENGYPLNSGVLPVGKPGSQGGSTVYVRAYNLTNWIEGIGHIPADAQGFAVAPVSEDTRIATVETVDAAAGVMKVTGVKTGTTGIVFTPEGTDEPYYLSVEVNNFPAAEGGMRIQQGKKNVSADGHMLAVGKTAAFTVAYTPANAVQKAVYWTTGAEYGLLGDEAWGTIVEVDSETGKVTGLNPGTAELVAVNHFTGYRATCTVVVYDAITKITPTAKNITLAPGQEFAQAILSVAGGEAVRAEQARLDPWQPPAFGEAYTGLHTAIRYTSDTPGVVLVAGEGDSDIPAATATGFYRHSWGPTMQNYVNLVPRGLGKATITAENLATNKKITFTVTVAAGAAQATGITFGKDSYAVAPGKSVTLKGTVAYDGSVKSAGSGLAWEAYGVAGYEYSDPAAADWRDAITIDAATGKVTAAKGVVFARVLVSATVPGGYEDDFIYGTKPLRASIFVTVRTDPKKITLTLDPAVRYDANAGSEYSLPTVKADSEAATAGLKYLRPTWKTSDAGIAFINSDGLLESTGKTGAVTLTATTYNGKAAKITLSFAAREP